MENKRLFGKICYLHRQMCRENTAILLEYGVTPVQMHAMIFINKSAADGLKVCQKDVEKEVNLRASSVSTLISNLENDGFLIRTVAEGDARTKFLELTQKGKDVCLKDKLIMEQCDGAIQAALTEMEQEEFEKLLKKIIADISKQKESEDKNL